MIHRLINFKSFVDNRGSLVSLEYNKEIPFNIRRIYNLYNIENGSERGFHAHINLKQILICVSGSCLVTLDFVKNREEITLDSPSKGLLLDGLIWREIKNFSPNCVLTVIASDIYDEKDYIRSYDDYVEKFNYKLEMKYKNNK